MSSHQPETQSLMRHRVLSAGLKARGICVLHQNLEHRFDLVENIPKSWLVRDIIGLLEADVFPTEVAARFASAHDQARDSGEDRMLTFDLGEGLRRRVFEAQMQSDRDGVVIIIADITETRAHEAAVTSLLREVSHRSKNLLSIIQSVAMQTAHHSLGIQDFLDKFRGRLHALSSTQDLVTESNWCGTYLHSLIASQLTRIGSNRLADVRVTGANPLLGPNASLHIGLAIHELGTNAALHGALAHDKPGHVWVDAQITNHPGQDADLVIEWQEVGIDTGETIQPPRFGTLVLQRIVPLSLGGTAQFKIEPGGMRYRLVVPADQFEV